MTTKDHILNDLAEELELYATRHNAADIKPEHHIKSELGLGMDEVVAILCWAEDEYIISIPNETEDAILDDDWTVQQLVDAIHSVL